MKYSARFDEALVFASQLHRNQKRKGNSSPYITHLLAVTAIVGENGGSEDEVIAALLHDAVEDQGGAVVREEIRRRFGTAVADIVDGCSDTDQTPKPPWRQRKQAYLDHLPGASRAVQLVSLADKLHNSRSILFDLREVGNSTWERFKGGKEGTLWYYRSLVSIFLARGPQPLARELQRVVAEIEELVDLDE